MDRRGLGSLSCVLICNLVALYPSVSRNPPYRYGFHSSIEKVGRVYDIGCEPLPWPGAINLG